jgi:hypothetical protein
MALPETQSDSGKTRFDCIASGRMPKTQVFLAISRDIAT